MYEAMLVCGGMECAIAWWLSSRGKLRRRPETPWWFWATALVHLLFSVAMVAYPFVTDGTLDSIFLLLVLAMVLHWPLCRWECVLSAVEKKGLYIDYEMGSHPQHQWYMEFFSPAQCVAIAALCMASWLAAFAVLLRRSCS